MTNPARPRRCARKLRHSVTPGQGRTGTCRGPADRLAAMGFNHDQRKPGGRLPRFLGLPGDVDQSPAGMCVAWSRQPNVRGTHRAARSGHRDRTRRGGRVARVFGQRQIHAAAACRRPRSSYRWADRARRQKPSTGSTHAVRWSFRNLACCRGDPSRRRTRCTPTRRREPPGLPSMRRRKRGERPYLTPISFLAVASAVSACARTRPLSGAGSCRPSPDRQAQATSADRGRSGMMPGDRIGSPLLQGLSPVLGTPAAGVG
jgi:hypothetical protein